MYTLTARHLTTFTAPYKRAFSAMSKTQDLTKLLKNPKLLASKGYVNGKWVSGSDNKLFPVINPATGATITEIPNMPREQIKEAISLAKTAFKSYSATNPFYRQSLMLKYHRAIEDNAEDLAIILSSENGKPLPEARTEISASLGIMQWFAGEAVRTYGHTVASAIPGVRNTVIKQAIGVCGLITPWNFPSLMIARKLAPALATGCTVVIKTPAETPLSALAMAVLAEQVGIPDGVINVVTVAKGEREIACGEEFCTNPQVSKISFTGSTPVGRLLMKQSSSTLKKLSFELGGNAAFIIFDDADMDLAIAGVIASKFRASGQTCVCANRIFVHAKIYEEFSQRLAEKVKAFKIGDPLVEGVNIGPLVNEAGITKVDKHVQDAISKGGRVLVGGKKHENNPGGTFYEPTVIVDVPASAAVAAEETFGPLAALFKFETDEEVIERANDTDMGLAGYFYTRDINRVNKVAEALQVGMVGVNTGLVSQPSIPFGGVKQSGFGREGGKSGIDEYLQEKLITVAGPA